VRKGAFIICASELLSTWPFSVSLLLIIRGAFPVCFFQPQPVDRESGNHLTF
jgi:hypothetical protein